MSRTVVLQQECEEGIFPHSPAILRQHSRSAVVRVASGCKQAISGDANIESAHSKAASLQTDLTSGQCIGWWVSNAIEAFSVVGQFLFHRYLQLVVEARFSVIIG